MTKHEHKCEECAHGVFNYERGEWECKYANFPNREECEEIAERKRSDLNE